MNKQAKRQLVGLRTCHQPNWAVKRTPTLAMASVGTLRLRLRRRLPWALGHMNKAEALAVIQASFERGSDTPCSWAPDRDAYIKQKQRELLELVIEPVVANITDEAFSYGVKQKLSSAPVFAIARRADAWLLYEPIANVFSLASGNSPAAVSILGFASSDALAEWLG